MITATQNPMPTLAAALRNRWHILFVATIAIGLLLGSFALSLPKTYTSKTTLFVRPLPGNPLTSHTMRNSRTLNSAMTTEVELLRSNTLTNTATKETGYGLSRTSAPIQAVASPNTQTMEIKSSAPTAHDAQQSASLSISSYLRERGRRAEEHRERKITRWKDAADISRTSRDWAIQSARAQHQKPDHSSQVQSYTTDWSSAKRHIRALKRKASVGPGFVVEAETPIASNPAKLPNLIGIGVISIVIGYFFSLWFEWRARRRSVRRLIDKVRLPLLSGAPAHHHTPPDDVVDSAHTPTALQHRYTATAIAAAAHETRLVAITSLADGETPDLQINLIQALAGLENDTLVVDARGGRPNLTSRLGLDGCPGLSDALSQGLVDRDAVRTVAGTRVYPAGRDLAASTDSLANPALPPLLATLKEYAGLVVVAAPPLSQPVGQDVCLATGTTLISIPETCTAHRLNRGLQTANRLGVDVVGLVDGACHTRSPSWTGRRVEHDPNSHFRARNPLDALTSNNSIPAWKLGIHKQAQRLSETRSVDPRHGSGPATNTKYREDNSTNAECS